MKSSRSVVAVAPIALGLLCFAAASAGAVDTDTTALPETVTASGVPAVPAAPPAVPVATTGWQRDETIIVSAASGNRETDPPRRTVRTWLTDSKGVRTTHPTHLMVRNDGTKYCTVWGAAIRFASHGDSFATTVEAGETRFFALPPDPDENITAPNTIVTIEWWNDGTLATLSPARPAATPTPYYAPDIIGDPYYNQAIEVRPWYYAPVYTYRPSFYYGSPRFFYDANLACAPAYVGTVYSNNFNSGYQYIGEGYNGYYPGYTPGYVGPPIVYSTTVYAAPAHHDHHDLRPAPPTPAPVGVVRPPHQSVGVRRVPKRPMITQMATQPAALPPGASLSPVTPPAALPAAQTVYTPTISVRSPEPTRPDTRPQPGRLDLRNPAPVARRAPSPVTPAPAAPPRESRVWSTVTTSATVRDAAPPATRQPIATEVSRPVYRQPETARPVYRQPIVTEVSRPVYHQPSPETRREPTYEMRRAPVVAPPPAPVRVAPSSPAPAPTPAPAKVTPIPSTSSGEDKGPRPGGRKP